MNITFNGKEINLEDLAKHLDARTKDLKNVGELSSEVTPSYPFRSNRNAKNLPKQYETNTEPSKTIPDQTLSITEILKRYASGLPLEGARVPIYNGDEAVPDTRKMDLSEIEDLKRSNQEHIQELQKDLQTKKTTKSKAEETKPKEEDTTS